MTLEFIKDGEIQYETTLIIGQILIAVGSTFICCSNIMLGRQSIPEVVGVPATTLPGTGKNLTTNSSYFDT